MFEVGTQITVTRGKNRGKTAKTLGPADSGGNYAVQFEDGTYGLVNSTSLKAPAESTIGEAKLAAEIQTAAQDAVHFQGETAAMDVITALVSRLSGDMPGLGARISWPAEGPNDIHRAEQRD